MSTARPLSSLLSAGAVVALTLAAPGTALADPGKGGGGPGAGQPGGHGGSSAAQHRENGASEKRGQHRSGGDAPVSGAKPERPEPAQEQRSTGQPAEQPAGATQPAGAGSEQPGDPAGNNGTIKIDTVPGDADRANRPHPGCAFVLQFFGFDAGQTADITFSAQAPTRSPGPLHSLSGQAISTSPADGALEEGHSLTLTAAELGLVGTPTAAKGWHVKVAVDALEAPGGAKQKVFWLDCSADVAAVTEEQEVEQDAAAAPVDDARSEQLEQPASGLFAGSGEDVGVLSGSATRETVTGVGTAERDAASVGGETAATLAAAGAAAQTAGVDETSTRASVLPFTGAAGLAAMGAAGLGAVGAGALALRAGRRRTAAAR